MTEGMISEATEPIAEARPGSRAFGTATALLAVAVLTARAYQEFRHIDQPIFEGYVGRQIPTAMVARDLACGGSFFYPRLQTGPFPSWFLIEPPIYAQSVAWVHELTGISIARCGRAVSLIAMAGAAVAIAGLARKRFGLVAALWAAMFFVSWPVTIRFARAFQPDMFSLGLFLLGANFLGRCGASGGQSHPGRRAFTALGWFSLAIGLASKVTLFPLLIGLAKRDEKRPKFGNVRFLASTLVPALLWYAWAAWLTLASPGRSGGGQAADGFGFWLSAPGPLSLLSIKNVESIAASVVARAWTPLGLVFLTVLPGIWRTDRAFRLWGYALGSWFLLVGGKAHHGYYWLVPAPFLAILGGSWLNSISGAPGKLAGIRIPQVQRLFRFAFGCLTFIVGNVMAADTFETPAEWAPLTNDLSRIRALIDSRPGKPFVAHEAAIFVVDRPGFRWEWAAPAQQRAAAAFGASLEGESPAALLDFYVKQGAAWFLAIETDPEWIRQHEALSRHPGESRIVQRSSGLVLYKLTDTEAPVQSP